MVRNDAARCLLCDGRSAGLTYPYGTHWDGQRFDYLRCGDCGSSFLHPLPTGEQFGRMYDRAAYHDAFYVEETSRSCLLDVLPDLPDRGTLLDFGCGNGDFLRLAARHGFDAVGVELEESARINAAERSGCPVYPLDTLVRDGRRFDIIHLGDVLEHLPDPVATMRQLENFLAPGGKFFVEGPVEDNASPVFWAASIFGFAKRVANKPLHGTLPPFHLIRTSAAGQRAFFDRRLGYRVERFFVAETGWPYWNDGDRLGRPRGAGHLIKMVIGRTAIAAAAVGRIAGLSLGNRFGVVMSPRR